MKTKIHALLLSQLILSLAYGEVDKEALPNVEDGFDIIFFVKEPHIINPSS